jgi:exodeoxyribonuclease VII small subunit
MTKKSKSMDFEEALASLEGLVDAMEAGNLSLEESLKAFEQGIRLTRECQKALDAAEQKVQILVKAGELPESEPYADDKDAADAE